MAGTMDSLSRMTGYGSTESFEESRAGSVPGDSADQSALSNDRYLNENPVRLKSRTPSHSLLRMSPSSSTSIDRKSRSAASGATVTPTERASISMPPPSNPSSRRPLNEYVPSGKAPVLSSDSLKTSRSTDDAVKPMDTTRNVLDNSDEKTPSVSGAQADNVARLALPDPSLKISSPASGDMEISSNRLSFSSLRSIGSAIYSQGRSANSAASSNADSLHSGLERVPSNNMPISPTRSAIRGDSHPPTTATDPVSVMASQNRYNKIEDLEGRNPGSESLDQWTSGSLGRNPKPPRRSRSKINRRQSGSNVVSSAASPSSSDRAPVSSLGKIGVCALDVKARSKANRNILTRLQNNGEFDVKIFGDKVILDESVENWPTCDLLISFFSDGFPLEKAIAYDKLRKPFSINDLPMQMILWDRRLCLRILDCMGVPTPERVEVNRDGGPRMANAELAKHARKLSGLHLEGPEDGTGGTLPKASSVTMIDDGDTLLVDGKTLKKPFVEKPISGEDHNLRIYFPKSHMGGGGRKLFRKIGNKSSEWDESLITPRAIYKEGSSYIYEKFLHVDNAEDIKAYTVGPHYCHAETRKSPVVDGLVRRNTHGKEIRYVTALTKEERTMASKIATGFGQRICGFDLLRANGKSYVIDVNGWSFVKDNNEYYDRCASIVKQIYSEYKGLSGAGTLSSAVTDDKPVVEHPPVRKHVSGHRATLKSLIKSPSMGKLAPNHASRQHEHVSPDTNSSTTPLSLPPTFDRNAKSNEAHATVTKTAVKDLLEGANDRVTAPQIAQKPAAGATAPADLPQPSAKYDWKLKGIVSVIRHADRTPKQKFKFTFHTQPFVDLLRGHQEEVLLKGEAALYSVLEATKIAMQQKIEDLDKLQLLKTSLVRKFKEAGTKVQIKPMFRKRKVEEQEAALQSLEEQVPIVDGLIVQEPEADEMSRPHTRSDSFAGVTLSRFSAAENDLVLDKLQLIIKWGGEPTHSARYQSQDLGENMRADLSLLNKEILDDVKVFTSSERRVSTSAQIWAASFQDQKEAAEDAIQVRKDLLDDSNAAKDVMDKVKKKLKLLLREGCQAPAQFAWPSNVPEPFVVVQKVVALMQFHRKVMRHNFKKIDGSAAAKLSSLNENGSPSGIGGSLGQAQAVSSIQARWCCGEDAELFKERWEKLFSEFCDQEKVDPRYAISTNLSYP